MTYTYTDGSQSQTTVSVNGQALPCPSEMSVSKDDLHVETERNAAGVLMGELVRSDVVKLELKWNYLKAADYVRLEGILGKNLWKPVQYLEANGGTRSLSMYKGTVKATPHRLLETGRIDGYLNVAVNLIER